MPVYGAASNRAIRQIFQLSRAIIPLEIFSDGKPKFQDCIMFSELFIHEHKFACSTRKDEAAMSAVDKLVNILLNFTPEQLKQFLNDPVTRSVLQLEEEAEPDLLEVS